MRVDGPRVSRALGVAAVAADHVPQDARRARRRRRGGPAQRFDPGPRHNRFEEKGKRPVVRAALHLIRHAGRRAVPVVSSRDAGIQ